MTGAQLLLGEEPPPVASKSKRERAPRRQPDVANVEAWRAAHVERMTPDAFRDFCERRRRGERAA